MNSYRNLGVNNTALGKNLEKLSSGYKINRAGDDAAGLAISEKMRAQITGLQKAQDNANDGIALVQTAEGALTEVHSMLNRMTEIANQSANGTYQDEIDRENLQKDITSLKSEIDRIAESTNFNGINLLDGSLSGAGSAGKGGNLVGGAIGTFKAATATITGGDASGLTFAKDTFYVDGSKVEVDWASLNAEEQAALKLDFTSATAAQTKTAAEIMEKAINAAIDQTNKDTGNTIEHVSVTSSAAGEFKITSGLDGSNESSVQLFGTSTSVAKDVLGKAGTANQFTSIASATEQLTINPANAEGTFTMMVDGEEIQVDTVNDGASALASNSTSAAIVADLQSAIDAALTNYDTAKGNTGDDVVSGKITVKFNDTGRLEFVNTSGKKIAFADKDGNDYAETLGISTSGKALANGGLTLQIGDTADDFNKLNVSVGDMSSNALGIANVDISTQDGASAAIEKIKNAINSVSSTRGDLGAIQNRLEHTINNLGVTEENMTSAESRIRDTDMAAEMMEYTKNNILIQASQAMLAQANQLPQGVLQLLG